MMLEMNSNYDLADMNTKNLYFYEYYIYLYLSKMKSISDSL